VSGANGKAKTLPREAYAHDADVLARRLLGCRLSVRDDAGVRHARIVETEAYLGERDLACHAARGRTARTESLYGRPGTAYVYLVYGMHELFNVVAAREDEPHAVLIRAVEPLDFHGRTHGPGLLTRALGIDRSDDRGDLVTGRIRVLDGAGPARVAVGPRIGVDYAGPWAAAPLRFGDADSPHLSKRFPAETARPR
jgi:DNA-3-methyladenine glycosylase